MPEDMKRLPTDSCGSINNDACKRDVLHFFQYNGRDDIVRTRHALDEVGSESKVSHQS